MKLIIEIPEEKYEFIKDLRNLIIGSRGNCKTIQHNVINAVKNGTPYNPKDEWMPVSERLPEIGAQVLCCNECGSVFVSAITYMSESGRVKFGKHYGVIAWRPLSKPYELQKGGTE